MSQDSIRQYTHLDQNGVRQLYNTTEYERKKSKVLNDLKTRKSVRHSWQAGMVSMVGIHLVSKRPTWNMALLELFVWTVSLGIFWYKRISQEYDSQLKEKTETMIEILRDLDKEDKSNAWIMENKNKVIIGVVVLKYSGGEGKIGLISQDSEIRHRLVKSAIDFAKSNKIGVISKWNIGSTCSDGCL